MAERIRPGRVRKGKRICHRSSPEFCSRQCPASTQKKTPRVCLWKENEARPPPRLLLLPQEAWLCEELAGHRCCCFSSSARHAVCDRAVRSMKSGRSSTEASLFSSSATILNACASAQRLVTACCSTSCNMWFVHTARSKNIEIDVSVPPAVLIELPCWARDRPHSPFQTNLGGLSGFSHPAPALSRTNKGHEFSQPYFSCSTGVHALHQGSQVIPGHFCRRQHSPEHFFQVVCAAIAQADRGASFPVRFESKRQAQGGCVLAGKGRKNVLKNSFVHPVAPNALTKVPVSAVRLFCTAPRGRHVCFGSASASLFTFYTAVPFFSNDSNPNPNAGRER